MTSLSRARPAKALTRLPKGNGATGITTKPLKNKRIPASAEASGNRRELGDEGFEPSSHPLISAEKPTKSQSGGAKSGALDANLSFLITTWGQLTADQRSVVLALVRSCLDTPPASPAEPRQRDQRKRQGPSNTNPPKPQKTAGHSLSRCLPEGSHTTASVPAVHVCSATGRKASRC
jgi:hypothetical protein